LEEFKKIYYIMKTTGGELFAIYLE